MQKPLTSSVALGGGCPVTGQSEAMSDRKASLPERIAGFLFGAVAYLVFGGTFLYAIGFVAGMVVPKDIDGGTVVPALEALHDQRVADVAVRGSAQRHGAQALQAVVDAVRARIRSSAASMCCSRASC